jgi:hypothetical protein
MLSYPSDQVSDSQSMSGLCGGISYSISDVPATGVASFSVGQLTISASGVVSIWTDVALSIGLHTITVTASLSLYSSVAPISKDFTLTVVPNCELT